MICRRSEVIPVECVVRGFLTGSGFKDYQQTGKVCGISLPTGMINSDRLDTPIFTPSTKADEGHDENISYVAACDMVGDELMSRVRSSSMTIYEKGAAYARERGIIVADTKFEFGLDASRELVLIDEVLTPDSSRFWSAEDWKPGIEQESFDKQYVRNYTETLVANGEWDKEYPGPVLPKEVVAITLERYEEALRLLTA